MDLKDHEGKVKHNGSPHLRGVVEQEFAAELHQVALQCKRGRHVWTWGRKKR